jgi:glycosyltransferase involved in cell wall biosynthesis
LRILEINTEKTWRGGERQTFFALKGFSALGCSIELLARRNYPLLTKATYEGFTCHAVNSHWGVIPFLLRSRNRYDIVHVQTANLLTFAILTKPFHKSKVVYTRRLDFVPTGWLTRWKYNQADMIVAISTPIKNILEKFGVRKLALIPECIEEKKLNKERAKQLLINLKLTNQKIIGTTAALFQHKDPKTMINAIEELSKTQQNFVLLHFGDGVLKSEVERLIREKSLNAQYLLMGFQQDVEDFFSIFDVFVMSSEEEGLGSSVLDAFVYKVPVVSTNAGGLAEILQNRGILVNVKDHKALAEALANVLNKPENQRQNVENAYEYVSKQLTLKNIHSEYLVLFKILLPSVKCVE